MGSRIDREGNIIFEQVVPIMTMFSSADTGLPKDWVYSPSIDLELKQYTLLGYLQRVKSRFAERKLYPHLEHVQSHVAELLHLQRSKERLANRLGGPLIGFDPATGSPIHERPVEDELLKVIDEVIEFAVPGLRKVQDEGLDLRQELTQHVVFIPVGLQPLHVSEGWLLLRTGKEARVYSYSMPILLEPKEDLRHRNLLTRYVTTFTLGIGRTYEHIKADLIRRHPSLPNPATFAVETDLELPRIETFMPLAKWLVQTHLTAPAH